MKTLDLAYFHEQALVTELLPTYTAKQRPGIVRRASIFFTATISPIVRSQPSVESATMQLKRFIEVLSQRTVELASTNLELNLEIRQRKLSEEALERSKSHTAELLVESEHLHQQMRRLSRKLISAYEDERRRISQELREVIAQTLTGINLRLATLKRAAVIDRKGLVENISRTQKLVGKSVEQVHQFARELRPVVLDDLGLIPALHSYLKHFSQRTGVRSKLATFLAIEELDTDRKTVLFRLAQEALINISRHSGAESAEIRMTRTKDAVCMQIRDDGRGFDVSRVMRSNRGRRLGLIGMRERVEMARGTFTIDSSPGNGTILLATFPLGNRKSRAARSIRNAAET